MRQTLKLYFISRAQSVNFYFCLQHANISFTVNTKYGLKFGASKFRVFFPPSHKIMKREQKTYFNVK
jgi:hypothetical protein